MLLPAEYRLDDPDADPVARRLNLPSFIQLVSRHDKHNCCRRIDSGERHARDLNAGNSIPVLRVDKTAAKIIVQIIKWR